MKTDIFPVPRTKEKK